MQSTAPPSDAMPIDGVYRLVENGKTYRIERGRIWILEQLFVGPIRYDPGQLTARDLIQTASNQYQGRELTVIGPITITAEPDRLVLDIVGAVLGPLQWTFLPVEQDDPNWYAAQLQTEEILARHDGGRASSAAGQNLLQPQEPSRLAPPADGLLSAAQRADFGGYHALVIGNNDYRSLPALATARNDARAISSLLREQYGFEVTTLQDATRADILTALRELRQTLRDSDNLLIYYAGHGWLDQDADEGYWLPVDAEEDSDINWISNATITSYLRSIQAKHVMIVADSCYSGTLTRGIKMDIRPPDYLNRIASQRARIVLSSGGLEPVADGGGGGQHSAFARYFLDELRANQGVLDSTTLYSKIRRPVMLAADQAPELADIRKAGHEGGDFLFIRAERSVPKR